MRLDSFNIGMVVEEYRSSTRPFTQSPGLPFFLFRFSISPFLFFTLNSPLPSSQSSASQVWKALTPFDPSTLRQAQGSPGSGRKIWELHSPPLPLAKSPPLSIACGKVRSPITVRAAAPLPTAALPSFRVLFLPVEHLWLPQGASSGKAHF